MLKSRFNIPSSPPKVCELEDKPIKLLKLKCKEKKEWGKTQTIQELGQYKICNIFF